MGGLINFNEIKDKQAEETYKCSEKGDKLSTEWIEKLSGVMISLREFVHNINRTPALAYRNGIYQAIQRDAVQMATWDGWEIGYKVTEIGNGFFQRKIFLKCEQALSTVPEEDSNPVFETAMHVFLDIGNAPPDMGLIAPDCMLITQNFAVAFLAEKNPNLVNHRGHS